MDKFIVTGGTPLQGVIDISGSKNATLPIIVAAAILGQTQSVVTNVPNLADVRTLQVVLRHLGSTTNFQNGTLTIDPIDLSSYEAPYDLVRRMRASIYVLGPLLARIGRAKVSFPGGCAIGPRPIDLHLEGLEALGADVEIEGGYINAQSNQLLPERCFWP